MAPRGGEHPIRKLSLTKNSLMRRVKQFTSRRGPATKHWEQQSLLCQQRVRGLTNTSQRSLLELFHRASEMISQMRLLLPTEYQPPAVPRFRGCSHALHGRKPGRLSQSAPRRFNCFFVNSAFPKIVFGVAIFLLPIIAVAPTGAYGPVTRRIKIRTSARAGPSDGGRHGNGYDQPAAGLCLRNTCWWSYPRLKTANANPDAR